MSQVMLWSIKGVDNESEALICMRLYTVSFYNCLLLRLLMAKKTPHNISWTNWLPEIPSLGYQPYLDLRQLLLRG